MASAIFFNGRRINIPQAVTKIDASGLPSASPASVGIVAIVGQAEGGVPLSVLESNADATQPSQIQKRYRSGELRTAALFAFQPSADEAVPGGAQKIIGVKVNPSVSSSVTLPDALAANSLILSAKDSGLFTNQISAEIEDGTNHGKKITVVFEDQTEVFDDAGGEPVFDVLYTPGSDGYDTMTGALSSSAFTAAGTKDANGQAGDRDADIPASGVVQIVSSDNGDTTQSVTIYGLSGGLLVQETIALDGTTPVVGSQSFSKVLCAKLVIPGSLPTGTILVNDTVIPTTLFTFTPGQLDKGGPRALSNMPVASVVTVSVDVDVAAKFVIIGTNAVGAVVSEVFDLTSANTTPVVGAVAFASITAVIPGDVPTARTVTMTMNAVHALTATFTTIRKLVDRLNALAGFTANADIGNPTAFLTKDCDFDAAVSLLSAADFYADTFVIAALLTSSSANVNAARATGASLRPANTPGAVFLSGGSEGTTTITQWQQALDLLKKRRYNHIILLTRDPAVHAALLAHLVLKNGVLKSECQGIVGIGKTDGTGETRSQIQSQIQTLSSRHLAFVSQQVEKFDPLTGLATLYPPYMLAAVAAGTKAGSAIGEPMTHKTIIATDIANDSSWSVEDDASALIDRGLMMYEKVDGKGIRCVRSITGYLADDNPVFGEYAANESLITSVFSLRNAIEKKVGGRGLANTAGAIKSLAFSELNAQVDEEIIFSSRGLQVDQVGDVFPVSVEIAPILGVNFIPITIHVALPTAQAA